MRFNVRVWIDFDRAFKANKNIFLDQLSEMTDNNVSIDDWMETTCGRIILKLSGRGMNLLTLFEAVKMAVWGNSEMFCEIEMESLNAPRLKGRIKSYDEMFPRTSVMAGDQPTTGQR